MRTLVISGALALGTIASPTLADDPRDPSMQSRAAREADAAEIRRLNNEQAAYVKRRDAEYAKGWQAYRQHPQAQAEYARRMAEWRRAVRLCESGRYEYCR